MSEQRWSQGCKVNGKSGDHRIEEQAIYNVYYTSRCSQRNWEKFCTFLWSMKSCEQECGASKGMPQILGKSCGYSIVEQPEYSMLKRAKLLTWYFGASKASGILLCKVCKVVSKVLWRGVKLADFFF